MTAYHVPHPADRPPQFAIGDQVRSRLDPSTGYIVCAYVVYESHTDYLVRDPTAGENIMHACELELGAREKDPVSADT